MNQETDDLKAEIEEILKAMGPLVHAGRDKASFRDGFVRIDPDFSLDECVLGLWGMAETERDKEEIAATIHVGERLYARVIDAARTRALASPVVEDAPEAAPGPGLDDPAEVSETEIAGLFRIDVKTLRRHLKDLPEAARPVRIGGLDRVRRKWRRSQIPALVAALSPPEPIREKVAKPLRTAAATKAAKKLPRKGKAVEKKPGATLLQRAGIDKHGKRGGSK